MIKAIAKFFSSPKNQVRTIVATVACWAGDKFIDGTLSWLGLTGIVICLFVYYRIFENLWKKVEQKDYKAVVSAGDEVFGLSDKQIATTVISEIKSPMPLDRLLNVSGNVVGRLMYSKDKTSLPPTSAILQVGFLPIDKDGKTVIWSRKWKYHIFNRSWTVLVSNSPLCDKFGMVFRETLDTNVDADKQLLLSDLYKKALKSGNDAPIPDFRFVKACWRPAETGKRAAYCFYLYVAKYSNISFMDQDVLKTVFGAKKAGECIHQTISLDGENRDSIKAPVSVDKLPLVSKDIEMEGVDLFVINRFHEFLDS